MSAETSPTISVVIPALNESESVGETVESVSEALTSLNVKYEIVVVDDGSQDETSSAARQAGAEVVKHVNTKGYGASLKTGVRAADGAWILILDADGTYPAAEIGPMLKASPGNELVIGARTKAGVQVPWLRRPMKWFLTRLAENLSGQTILDLNSGMRLFGREDFLTKCRNYPDGFSLTTTQTLMALSEKQAVRFVPIAYERRAGKSKFRPIQDTWGMLMLIVRTVMLFDPLRVFLPISGLLMLAALAVAFWTLRTTFLDTTFVVLLFASLQFFALGLLADLINRRR